MTGLVLWILFALQVADCLWYQDAHWTRQLSTDSSFFFTFLGVEEGYAEIKGDRQSQRLQINLRQNKESKRRIVIYLYMVSELYQTVPKFRADGLMSITFFHADSTKYPYQEVQILGILDFNVTLINRKQLELRSPQGIFLLNLIDIEEISPKIYGCLWELLILTVGLSQCYLILYFPQESWKTVHPTLGIWSGFLITTGSIRYIYNIYDQSYYLTDTGSSVILTFTTCSIGGLFFIEITQLSIEIIKNPPDGHLKFTKVNLIIAALLLVKFLFTPDPLELWPCLAIVVVYETAAICYNKQEDKSRNCQKIIALGILYLFPCLIYPAFSFQVRYPQDEAELWWLYGLFYLVEVAVFLWKSGEIFKMKRLVKLKTHKLFNRQAFLELEDKACPLCLKEVETSEVGMSPPGEAPQVDWIQAECGHHFHKACVRQNMQEDCCFFDNTKWTEEFKKAARQQ